MFSYILTGAASGAVVLRLKWECVQYLGRG
jgi:hypothetical protein